MTLLNQNSKRIFDVAITLSCLFILFVPIIAIAILVKLTSPGPAFFRQERLGLHERLFVLMKFRTMRQATTALDPALPDGARLTSLGRLLRKTSLDELPQLINVLKGEMSLVGPRPLLVSYLPFYTERERLRHSVKPGITGWAQVSGRNLLPWDRRLALDVSYVENWSMLLDFQILLKTPLSVLRSDGVLVNTQDHESSLDQERRERTAECRGSAVVTANTTCS
jgi:lipopolysaccharide/colanic/teichoic acid biosynthesis glycosyltransferase